MNKNYFLIRSPEERLKIHIDLKNKGYGRLIIETGIGIDLMHAETMVAVARAINDIIHRICIPAPDELGTYGLKDSVIIIDLGVPEPEDVDPGKIWELLPVKPMKLYVYPVKGGLETIGYRECRILVAVVSIHIYLPKNRVIDCSRQKTSHA